jgi:chaperonin GroES
MSKDKDVKIRPLDDRVVVETLEAEEKTAGGILLPDSAKQKPQRGRIVAVGAGKLLDDGSRAALAVAKGDEVIYGKYSGNDIKIESKEYKILRESDILAKVVK